jgi:cobalt/nickel transport system permease protein
MAEALALELTSAGTKDSWLARLDPRAKIVAIVVLIFGATFLHGLGPLAALLALALIMIFASGISSRRLMRVLSPAFLFSFAIILPSVLNVITPGPVALTLFHFPMGAKLGSWNLPDALTITRSGLLVAARFLLRTIACVTLSFLLIAGAGSAALLNGLRRLGMPRVFGMVLTMAERYLVVLLRAAEEIHLAKLSRTIEAGPLRREQRWVAAGIGILFRRTHNLAREVQDAMLARGYDGELQTANAGRMRVVDFAVVVASVVLIAALIIFDRFW